MIGLRPRLLAAPVVALWLAASSLAGGIDAVDFADPAAEARYQDLIGQLRCLVCQNQTIAESNAELAADMRAIVRQQVVDGHSKDQIIEFLTARYGDFVRYKPPLAARTVVLWFAPFCLALLALWLVPRLANRRRATAIPEDKRSEAKRLLAE